MKLRRGGQIITPIISLFTFQLSIHLESHAEHAPILGFKLAPSERCVLILVAGEIVERGTHVVDTTETLETGSFAFDSLKTVERIILKALQLLVHRTLGALPSHRGQFIGATVFPQNGIGIILFLAANTVRLGQLAAAAENRHTG